MRLNRTASSLTHCESENEKAAQLINRSWFSGGVVRAHWPPHHCGKMMISTLANPSIVWHIGHDRLIGPARARTQEITLHQRTSHQTDTSRTARLARRDMQARWRDAHRRRPRALAAVSVVPQGLVCQAPLSAGPSRPERTAVRPPPAPPRRYPTPARSARSRPRAPTAPACSRASLAPSPASMACCAFTAHARTLPTRVALPPVRPTRRQPDRRAAAAPSRIVDLDVERPCSQRLADREYARARHCARALALAHPCAPPPRRVEPLSARPTQAVGSRDVPLGTIRSPARSSPPRGRAQWGGAAPSWVAHWPRGPFAPYAFPKVSCSTDSSYDS